MYHRRASRFFSFLLSEDELSLTLDTAAYLAFIADAQIDSRAQLQSPVLPEIWRAIRVVGEFGAVWSVVLDLCCVL